ncbi:putative Isopentenyl-diphosphate Delta-isomerase II [Cocos nucifera]|uniref:Putative Isopentenyl-diphosphate Delta-isomerase II n=1 Tax=Cocos nucifera TaxID=13894 RepID=A0A8K0I5N2_COCNU|nr:putative Isopentenyl-diphosphate Delta-isomerase II [Cocos nucifera]
MEGRGEKVAMVVTEEVATSLEERRGWRRGSKCRETPLTVATSDDLSTLCNASKMESKRTFQGLSNGRDLDGLSPNNKRGVESYVGLVLDISGDDQSISTKFVIPSDAADPSCGLEVEEPDGSGDPKPDSKVTGSAVQTLERKERKKDKVIEEKIGCADNLHGFEDWKESFQVSHDLLKTSINGEIQQNQPECHGEPHSIRSSMGPAIESITGSAPSILVEFNSEEPATEGIIHPAPSVAIEDSFPCPATEGSSKPDSSVSKKFSSSGPDTEIGVDSVSSMNAKFTTTMPDAEGNIYPASKVFKHGPRKCSLMESKPQLKSRTAKGLGLPKFPANVLQQKNTAQVGSWKRHYCLSVFAQDHLASGAGFLLSLMPLSQISLGHLSYFLRLLPEGMALSALLYSMQKHVYSVLKKLLRASGFAAENPEERNLPDDAEANVRWQLLSGKDYEDKNMEEKILLRKATLFFQVDPILHQLEFLGYLVRKLQNFLWLLHGISSKGSRNVGNGPETLPVKYVSDLLQLANDNPGTPESLANKKGRVDYLLFIVRDVKLLPNPDEVADVKYVNQDQLKELLRKANAGEDGVKLSPWFRLVVDDFLIKWWDHLKKGTLQEAVDMKT